ncbi:DUF3040 domain-containing protein [Amycolatopsis sp. H20-H5]|uniref:DUF3040 domain-containing protein n=1 Tax=Amycolatopsis sp. H20-H5 TaxID=3046309 RepID=UPI002DBAC2FB|nr:DUF3040 domain-containing protein [Amycolatopsis sp. H20-H5]MEC3981719.1 DUF3040 domain-containing protein [Amycolatopsis sp. H20-H5]
MLSHYDRRELDKIEQWFEATDPALAAVLTTGKPARRPMGRRLLLICFDILAALLFVLGLITAGPALTLSGVLACALAVWLHALRHLSRPW